MFFVWPACFRFVLFVVYAIIGGMAMTYRPVDRDQEFLLPPNMVDWLAPDHLVWFVIEAVARLDTAAFHRLAKLGGVGRRGYDPDMVLTLFVYAMAHGVSSSRRMERLCATDVAFRVICAQDVPDHTVLARFRKKHQDALAGLLTKSLMLAAELGMVSLGVVALDGTKISGNASKEANRTEAGLRKLADEYLDTVAQTDAAEDGLFGEDSRGDETPPGTHDRTGRAERIDAALGQIAERRAREQEVSDEQAAKARAAEEAFAAGHKKWGHFPKGTDMVLIAKISWQRARDEASERYERRTRARERGEACGSTPPVPPDEHCRVRDAWGKYQARAAAAETAAHAAAADTSTSGGTGTASTDVGEKAGGKDKEPKANMTDPESRIMKTRNGWIQGYNGQTAASSDGFILYTRAMQDTNDTGQFIPTMNAVTTIAGQLAEHTGRADLAQVGILLADAGYDSDSNLAAPGPDRLIADCKRHTLNRRAETDPADGDPPDEATVREKMNHRLRTDDGKQLYKQRAPIIETPNAWIKDGRGLRQFSRRGQAAADSELGFAAAVTNLLKINTGGITATRLATG